MVDTLKEAEARIRLAMLPPRPASGNNFSPNIKNLRTAANQNKRFPLPPKQLTSGR